MTVENGLQSQEKLGGALAYVFFIIPILMDVKTDFTMFHAKQSLVLLFVSIIAYFVPWIGWILLVVISLISLWALYQAYLGNKFILPVIGENMDTILSKIGLIDFFSVKK